MKIRSIHFQNLNSLEGEWKIDFTHPAYQENSLFAITGPTGSGKTTLLDAICLALYGRTPRLKIISKSVNEILTRRTGFCFSEITFETRKGIYRCHWSQHRARKQPDGELQQPRHEIVDDDTNTVLENKIKDVSQKVEQVTGMNFDQFTRSILLAQGSFSAFLLAPPDERAPILEQITGTEIYSRISQLVHQRTAEEENSFKIQQAEIDNLAIITAEEETSLRQHLERERQDSELLAKQITEIQLIIAWFNQITGLEADVKRLAEEKQSLSILLDQSVEEKKALARARSALSIEPIFLNAHFLADEQKKEHKLLLQKDQEKENLDVLLKSLLSAKLSVNKDLDEIEDILEKEKSVIKNVRHLDLLVNELQKSLDEKHRSIALQTAKKKKKEQILSTLQEKLTRLSSTLATSQTYLLSHKKDENLHQYLAGFIEKYKRHEGLNEKINRLEKNLRTRKVQKENLAESLTDLKKNHTQAKDCQQRASDRLSRLSEEFEKLSSEFPDLRKQLETNTTQQVQHEKLLSLCNRLIELEKEKKDTKKKISNLSQSLQKKSQIRLSQENDISAQEKIVKKQQDIVTLSLKIVHFEKERSRLKSGHSCPLCGATEHPFAENVPQIEESEEHQSLVNEQQQLESLKKNLSELTTAITLDEKSINDLESSFIELRKQSESWIKEHDRLCSSLAINSSTVSTANIEKSLEELTSRRNMLNQAAEKLESLQNQINRNRNEVDSSKETVLSHERLLNEAAHEEVKLVEIIRQNQQDLQEHSDEITSLLSDLQKELLLYGIDSVTANSLKSLRQDLEKRHQKWQEQQNNQDVLVHEIKKHEAEIDKEKELLSLLQTELNTLTEQANTIKTEASGKAEQRFGLYGAKDPDKEEKRLLDKRSDIISHLKDIEKKHSSTSEKLAVAAEQQRLFQLSISKRKHLLEEEEKKLATLLLKNGFRDEEDFLQSKISEKQIEDGEDRLKELDKKNERNSTLLEEKQNTLSTEKNKNLCSEEPANVIKRLEKTELRQKEHHQVIGRIQGKLTDNTLLLKQQKELRDKLSAQKQELSKWLQLNSLIGSASGRKFCHFAQGITFEIMVQHANRNLRKMTDRYILMRNKIQPLELNIIDNYRAGDIRSTKNLSGGESFIVSLALALGLSNMASSNVRVDSLFLDEGFGTLDEETLETAIHNLASLQQEGKIIGIISHVATLKERINTQIEVIGGQRGHSTLRGPGISAL